MGKRANVTLKRTQVAVVLGLSNEQVAKMDGHELHPGRAKNRSWHYNADEVCAVLRKGMSSASPIAKMAEPDGKTTAAVFELFAARKSLVRVVIATKTAPGVVLALRHQYDALRGDMTFTREMVEQAKTLLDQPLRKGSHIVPALQRALDANFEAGRAQARLDRKLRETIGQQRPVGEPNVYESFDACRRTRRKQAC